MDECAGCGGKCCMDYVVALSVADVKRIAEGAGIKLEDFVGFTPVDEMEFRCPDVKVDGRYAYMTLRRDERGCCVLSVLDGDDVRCKVHGFHPMPCRIYPFTLEDGKVVHRRKFRCERKWGICETKKEHIRRLLDLRDREIKDYEGIAGVWNRRGGGSKKDFMSFIL